MKRQLNALLISAALLSSWVVLSAENAAPELVGDWGRPECLAFEGLRTYDRDEIVSGLKYRLDFHLAAHPAATLANYLDTIQRMVRAGYRRSGFPDVTVAANLDTNVQRIVVRLTEGPRFTCGDVRITGGKTLTNDIARARLVQSVTGGDPTVAAKLTTSFEESATKREAEASNTNLFAAMWMTGLPAPFDEAALDELTKRVRDTMPDLGYFNAKIVLKMVTDPTRQQADLHIQIEDEGIQGVLDEFEVTGNQKNSRKQVLKFLELKPGVEANAALMEQLETELWKSARFLEHRLSLSPLKETGRLKLTIALRELEEAPPLNREFPPATKAWLKFCDWLGDFENQAEDLVWSFSTSPEYGNLRGEVVISPSGLVFVSRPDRSNQPPVLSYAAVASSRLFGLYSATRQRKLTLERKRGYLSAFFEVLPNTDPDSENRFAMTMGAGLGTDETGQPLRLRIRLAPAAFAGQTATSQHSSLDQGVLTASGTDPSDDSRWLVRIHASTGRLLEGEYKSSGVSVRIHSEVGAFARVVQEIAAATASHPNNAVENKPWSSSLSFLAVDWVRLMPLIPDAPQADWDRLAAIIEKANPGKWFAPLDGLDWWAFVKPGQSPFVVPRTESAARKGKSGSVTENSGDPVAMVRRFLVCNADSLWPRGSWPWTLVREMAFASAGQPQFFEAEIQRLGQSDEIGSLGWLTLANLFRSAKADWLSTPITHAAETLSPVEFAKDWRLLLRQDSLIGQVLSNVLASLGALNTDDATALAGLLEPDDAVFLKQCVQSVRANKNQSLADALWPAIEQHWNKVFEPRFCMAFGQALSDWGQALQQRNQLAQAARMFETALSLQRKIPAENRPAYPATLQRLGSLRSQQGKPAEAEPLLREALAEYRKLGEESDPDIAKTLSWLGWSLESQGKLPEAEAAYREALAMQKELVGPGHPSYTSLLEAMARVISEQGRPADAEPLIHELLALQRKLRGNGVAEIARTLNWLAWVQKKQGKLAKAEARYREALAIQRKLVDGDPADIAKSLVGLGGVLMKQGKFKEAKVAYREAAETGNAEAMSGLAQLYARGEGVAKDEAEAANWYRKAIEQYRQKAEGGDAPAQNALAWLFATCPVSEIRDSRSAVAYAEKAVTATSRKVPNCLDTLAAAYAEAGQFDDAVTTQKEAVALLEDEETEKAFTARLRLYESKKPYREE